MPWGLERKRKQGKEKDTNTKRKPGGMQVNKMQSQKRNENKKQSSQIQSQQLFVSPKAM